MCGVVVGIPDMGLGIPFMYVCPFPWTRTRAFPQPLVTPETSVGGACARNAAAGTDKVWN